MVRCGNDKQLFLSYLQLNICAKAEQNGIWFNNPTGYF